MPHSHETPGLSVDSAPDDTDRFFNAGTVNPELEAIKAQFSVSEPTASVLKSIDRGGIHTGGYIDPEKAKGGVATATTEKGTAVWSRLQEKYGDRAVRELYLQAEGINEDNPTLSSNELKIPEGMSLEDARQLVVYATVGPNPTVRERPTQKFTAMSPNPGEELPSVLVGTADVKGSRGRFVLEVATGENQDGSMIGFSVTRRSWNTGEYPNDTGYSGVI